jgi:hypothetical protein
MSLSRGGDYMTKGRYYEVLFKAECLKRKIEVLSPECAYLPFDLAIFSEGKFLKIQIKGTSTLQVRPRRKSIDRFYRFNVKNARKQSYSSLGVDFIAGFVEPLDRWYIMPAAEVAGCPAIEIRPNAVGRAATYREAWGYLAPSLPAPYEFLGRADGFDRRTEHRERIPAGFLDEPK